MLPDLSRLALERRDEEATAYPADIVRYEAGGTYVGPNEDGTFLLEAAVYLDAAHYGICHGSFGIFADNQRQADGGRDAGMRISNCDSYGYFMSTDVFESDAAQASEIARRERTGTALPATGAIYGTFRDGNPTMDITVPTKTGEETMTVVSLWGSMSETLRAEATAMGATYNDPKSVPLFRRVMDSVVRKLPKPKRTLADYVDKMCMAPPLGAGKRGAALMERVSIRGAPEMVRDTKSGEMVPAPPESIIQLGNAVDGFQRELIGWSHFVMLDEQTPPRGSLFLRYVDAVDAMQKYPEVPIFRPDHVDPVRWELFMEQLRLAKFKGDMEQGTKLERMEQEIQQLREQAAEAERPQRRRQLEQDAKKRERELRAARMEHVEFDIQSFLESTASTFGDCHPYRSRADGQPVATDYLYVILVCSRGAGYGVSQLKAARRLAQELGLRRVVLSALPSVVSYYKYSDSYDLVTRHGRDLSYVQQRPAADPFQIAVSAPGAPLKFALDVYNSRPMAPEDFRDPTIPDDEWRIPNPPLPYYAAYKRFLSASSAAARVVRHVRRARRWAPY